MIYDESALLDADLDCLIAFLVVHREGGVSRAAECLGVKQPAVSNQLAKLRARFGDELFVGKRAWTPTERADQIAAALAPVFNSLQDAISALEEAQKENDLDLRQP